MPEQDQKYKADGGKPCPSLLEKDCVLALEAVQATLDYGAQKYEARSWKGVDMQRYDDAARRHRIARDRGEIFDKESGLMHKAHEIICLVFQLETAIEQMLSDGYELDFHTQYKEPPQDHKED